MKLILPFFAIVFTLIINNSAIAQNKYALVKNNKTQSIVASQPARISHFSGTITKDRVVLNWTIAKNLQADQFEVERSTDGKNFVLAALVFCTDQPDEAEYQFYEKLKKVTYYYRLKIIHKDHTVDYSDTIFPEATTELN